MGDEFIEKLMVGVGGDTSALATSFAGISPMLGKLGGMFSQFGAVAIPAAFVLAGVAIAGFAVNAAKEVGSGFRIIKQRTGEVGPVLEKLGEDYRKVLGQVPEHAKDVGEAMSLVRQRTGEIGKPLEDMTRKLLNLARITDSDVKPLVDSATGAFNVWNIATKNQSTALDYLYKVSAATGSNINALMETTKTTAPIAQILGWSFEKTAAFAGQLTKEGLSADKVFAGLRMGLKQVAKAGKDPQTEFPKIMNAIKGAKTETEAITLATTMFGRAAVSVVKPIRDGKLNVDDFMASLQKGGPTIDDTANRTLTLGQMIEQLKNLFNLALEPLGKPILQGLKAGVEWAIRNMPTFQKAFKDGLQVVKDWAEGVKILGDGLDKTFVHMKLSSLYFFEQLKSGAAKTNIQHDIAMYQLQLDLMNGTTKQHMAEMRDLWDKGLGDVARTFIAKTPELAGDMGTLVGAIISTLRPEDLADKTHDQIFRMAALIASDTGLPLEAITKLLLTLQAEFLGNPLAPQIGPAEGDPLPSVQGKQQTAQDWLTGNLLHPQVGNAEGSSNMADVWQGFQNFFNTHYLTPIVGPAKTNNPGIMSWPTNAAAGVHVAGEVMAGMQGYFDANMTNPVVGAAGGAGVELSSLNAAWEALNKTAIYGWSEATNVAAGRFKDMEDAIMGLSNETGAYDEAMGSQLATWRNMRGALDAANASLKNYDAQIKLSEATIAGLEKTQTAYNDALQKSKDELQKLSSMKLAGEGAASDASFAKQQEINKLELERYQIELRIANHQQTRADYARLSEIKTAEDKLNLEKQIIDTQASLEIDAQKRELEKLLDPLGQQEMSYEDIKNRIIDLTNNIIPAQQKQYDDITSQLETQNAALEGIRNAHDLAAQAVATYSAQVEEMAKNFLARYDQMIAKAKELAAPGTPTETHHGGGIVMHSGGEVEAILKRHEFVMQESAVSKYGVGFMNAINRGSAPAGGNVSFGDVILQSVSPDYDSERLIELTMNKIARRSAHTGRLLRGKGRI